MFGSESTKSFLVIMSAAFLLRSNIIKCSKINGTLYSLYSKGISTTSGDWQWRSASNQSAGVERKLLLKDKLTENFKLIYRAPMENYVTWTKNVSTLTVTTIVAIAGYQLATDLNYLALTTKLDLEPLVSHENDLWYYVAGFVLINMAIRSFVAKYPLRIYKSNDKYIAVFESQLPVGIVKHHFKKGEVSEYKNVLNPWSHITYRLGNRASMLLLSYFKTPSEFHELFGAK